MTNAQHQAEYRRRRRKYKEEMEEEIRDLKAEVRQLHRKIAEDDTLRREVNRLIQRINDLT